MRIRFAALALLLNLMGISNESLLDSLCLTRSKEHIPQNIWGIFLRGVVLPAAVISIENPVKADKVGM